MKINQKSLLKIKNKFVQEKKEKKLTPYKIDEWRD